MQPNHALIADINELIEQRISTADQLPRLNFKHYEYMELYWLYLKLKSSPLKQCRIVYKMEQVKAFLAYTDLPLLEISYELDCDNAKYLSSQFKRVAGLSPTDYRLKQRQKMNVPASVVPF